VLRKMEIPWDRRESGLAGKIHKSDKKEKKAKSKRHSPLRKKGGSHKSSPIATKTARTQGVREGQYGGGNKSGFSRFGGHQTKSTSKSKTI